jgi:3-hydroxymyristoyl/3-hydroxydecanoyl-(acyl carrier protein) dehydratase
MAVIALAPFDVAPDHPAFAGHFPGRPILPGVVLLDAALQRLEADGHIDLANCRVNSVKFQGIVEPGDRLHGEYTFAARGSIRLTLSVRERVVLTASVLTWPRAGAGPDAL